MANSSASDARQQGPLGFSGFTLGRVSGIEIGIDWSLAIIFLLILFGLATGWFPRWHPDWSAGLVWISALVAAVLFFASVLAHELSHALVGRRRGIPVSRITLFMFGGLAHMDREPPSAGAEFQMAIIGPITSIVIGLVSLFLVQFFVPPGVEQAGTTDPAALMAQLGPAASVLIWLGFINVVLGIFNMLPGFPLDGGRVLRAGLWKVTGDRQKATLWSSWAGRGFAALLIAYGVFLVVGPGIWGGLWWVLIGWFLYVAARGSYEQLAIHNALEGIPVRRLMRSGLMTVPHDIAVTELVDEYVMASDQHAFPVMRGEQLMGLVSQEDVRRVAREERDRVRVDQIMTPAEALTTLSPDDAASAALDAIAGRGFGHVPVLEHGRLAGMVRREDILKWLALNGPPRR